MHAYTYTYIHTYPYAQVAHGMLRASVWYERFVPAEPQAAQKGGFHIGRILEALREDTVAGFT
jgi:hypothetical protein